MLSTLEIKRYKQAGDIAFTVWMIFFTMLFGALFLYYALYRFRGTPWPPMGFEEVSLAIPIISTFIMGASSFLAQRAVNLVKKNSTQARSYIKLTLLSGFGFLGSQFYLWKNLKNTGMGVESGIFSSLIHAFTWVHAGHIILGIILLSYLAMLLKKNNDFFLIQKAEQIVKFWHFLGVVWIVMFVSLFLI